MPDSMSTPFTLPWLPPAYTVIVPGRGEFFVRHHQHRDPDAPLVVLLHGWTASADIQFVTAYPALAEHCSFIGIDHRGHGRGLRPYEAFTLEDAADDMALVLRRLGLNSAIAVGYSMGGPISMLLARRHPDLVAGLVVQATALEWSVKLADRVKWWLLPLLGSVLRSRGSKFALRHLLPRVLHADHEFGPYVPWLLGELQRSSPDGLVEAGRALRHYDARPWASSLDQPAAQLITTKDRLVRPRKQWALANALGSEVRELDHDHLVTLEHPSAYAGVTVDLVRSVADRIGRNSVRDRLVVDQSEAVTAPSDRSSS